MAISKKRKLFDDGGTGDVIADGGRKEKKRRVSKKKTPSESLMMKLPGELRNKIYNLSLLQDGQIQVRLQKRKYSWREPSLLKVSKQIRTEAMTLYYLSNKFRICAPSSEIEQARLWLQRISQQCSLGERVRCEIYVKSPSWDDIASWDSLAKLAYESDDTIRKYSRSKRRRSFWQQNMVYCSVSCPYKNLYLATALDNVAMLGLKARDRKMSYEKLQANFEDWATSQVKVCRALGSRRIRSMIDSLETKYGRRFR